MSKNRFSIGLHWLEFTIHDKPILDTINELNKYNDNDLSSANGNLYGYMDMIVGKAGVIILSDSRYTHHHIILPGRWLTEVGDKAIELLPWILKNSGKLSRIDIACDDFTEKPNPKTLREYCNEGQLVTRFRRRTSLESHSDNSITNYFGSMKSDRYLRVYDKTKETKGKIIATRWEIVMRDEYAQQCAQHIIETGVNKTFKGSLLSLMDFRIPTTQKRESRRKKMDWYIDFIGNIEKAEYTRYEPTITLEKMEHWLQKQVSRTLANVLYCKKGDMGFIYDMIHKGSQQKRRI